MIAFVRVLYTEPDPSTYGGIHLHIDGWERLFASGTPTVDYLAACVVTMDRLGENARMMGSSSIDHFVMDGGDLETEHPTPQQVQAAMRLARENG
jgi:hypothetical protein